MGNDPGGDPSAPILVPELRDYHQINAEAVRRLDRGASFVRLEGPAGHRLLLAGLSGPWRAVVEVAGQAGPELAAGLDAPGLTIVCRGVSADGAGSGLRAGTLLLLGATGTAVGYRMSGGLIVAAKRVGPRAGLGMTGGEMVLLDHVGPMAGERQSGGVLAVAVPEAIPHFGLNARGGRRLLGPSDGGIVEQALELIALHSSHPGWEG
ncbi:glutamate synthase [Paludisphaera rhizosphaerae]|uniref:glutamate synthase n=1 Tax=Paludisphaera rhizosphaerae TaxID=2711216 RepID=UPI0013EBAC8A|nr:glutamate synthase [Paludisphaera rhizosphaerae]